MTDPAGYSRISWCRGCRDDSRQIRAGHENTSKPLAEYWRCTRCGLQLVTYANVLDAEGLCYTVADKFLHGKSSVDYGDVKSIDRNDLHSEMMAALWKLYLDWRPDLCPSFLAYVAGGLLVQRGIVDYLRVQHRSRGGVPKPLVCALSLEALDRTAVDGGKFGGERDGEPSYLSRAGGDRLGGVTDESDRRVRADSDAALRRVYAEGSRRLARQNRGVGLSRAEFLA